MPLEPGLDFAGKGKYFWQGSGPLGEAAENNNNNIHVRGFQNSLAPESLVRKI